MYNKSRFFHALDTSINMLLRYYRIQIFHTKDTRRNRYNNLCIVYRYDIEWLFPSLVPYILGIFSKLWVTFEFQKHRSLCSFAFFLSFQMVFVCARSTMPYYANINELPATNNKDQYSISLRWISMHKICINNYLVIRLFSLSNQMKYLSIDLSSPYYVYVKLFVSLLLNVWVTRVMEMIVTPMTRTKRKVAEKIRRWMLSRLRVHYAFFFSFLCVFFAFSNSLKLP